MKKLENFEKEKVNIKNLWGGIDVSTKSTTYEECCTTLTSDSFNDVNGDGKWGEKESGIICVVTTCL